MFRLSSAIYQSNQSSAINNVYSTNAADARLYLQSETYNCDLDLNESVEVVELPNCVQNSIISDASHFPLQDLLQNVLEDKFTPSDNLAKLAGDELEYLKSKISLKLTSNKWELGKPVLKDNKKMKVGAKWYSLLVSKLYEKDILCVLSFCKTHISPPWSRKRCSPQLKTTAVCKHDRCRKFLFTCWGRPEENGSVEIFVDIVGKLNHSDFPRFRRTNVEEMKDISTRLLTQPPDAVYENLLSEAPKNFLQSGNFQLPKSLSVIRQIKSQMESTNKIESNVFAELRMMYSVWKNLDNDKDVPGFMQQITDKPFQVIMFTEKQVKLLRSLKSPVVLHLDATGSIVRRFQGLEKRILLYSLVVSNTNVGEPPIAVVEMLSEAHDTCSILAMLQRFFQAVNAVSNKSVSYMFPKSMVVTDFSWALVHAVLFGLSMMDIHKYLRLTYKCLVEKKSLERNNGCIFMLKSRYKLVCQALL